MLEFDLEQIIFKPVVVRAPFMQIMQRIVLNGIPLGPFPFCLYLIMHPKGPTESDRI